jgi:anti-sigma factor RsiW
MHLDAQVLDALACGELDADTDRAARDHLHECAACRSRFDEFVVSERGVSKLLHSLDHRPPAVDVGAVIGRARTLTARTRRGRRVAAWAAGTGTLLAAALAAALPNSPIAGYVRAMFDRPSAAPTSAVAVPRVMRESPGTGSIAVGATRDVKVTFLASQRAGEIRIALSPDRILRVTPVGAGASETTRRYAVAPGTLTVDNTGSGASYELTLPASAPHARVVVGARPVFAIDGRRVTTVAVPDGAGHYVFQFSTPVDPRSQ